jgi:hypothetical protein
MNDDDSGIYVRALVAGPYGFDDGYIATVPIESLTFESLFKWLRSTGGENILAENTVFALLGYKERVEPGMLPQQYEEEAAADKQAIMRAIEK